MGFLERLKQQREADVRKEQDRLAQIEAKQQADLKAQEERTRIVQERRANARKYYEESFFPQMVEELCRLNVVSMEHTSGTARKTWTSQWRDKSLPIAKVSNDSDVVTLEIQEETYGYGRIQKFTVIETKYNGVLVVHGGLFGSTKLLESSWRGRREIQEKALEKAYENPISIRDWDERPSTSAFSRYF